MVKKKQRNPLLALLNRSASGWGNAIGYMWTGQWAKDISRAAHRSGSGKRAVQRARAAPNPRIEEARVKYPDSVDDWAIGELTVDEKLKGQKLKPWDRSDLICVEVAKAGSKDPDIIAVAKQVKDAQKAAANQTTKVEGHNLSTAKNGKRQGHQRKLNSAERRAVIARKLSKTKPNGSVKP